MAGEIFGPWLQRGLIKRIASGPDLKQQRIKTKLASQIQDGEQFGFLLGGGKAALRGPIDVANDRYPRATKLASRRRGFYVRRNVGRKRRRCGRRTHKQSAKERKT